MKTRLVNGEVSKRNKLRGYDNLFGSCKGEGEECWTLVREEAEDETLRDGAIFLFVVVVLETLCTCLQCVMCKLFFFH